MTRTYIHINKVDQKNKDEAEEEKKKENRGIDSSFVRSSSIYLNHSPSHLSFFCFRS